MDTFKLFINPKTRNAPHEKVAESEEKVDAFEELSEGRSAEKDKAGSVPRAKNEKEEAKLKARLKEYGSNVTFTNVTSKPTKVELKNNQSTGQTARVGNKKEERIKSGDEVSWTDHPLLPKGWCVAPRQQQQQQQQQAAQVMPRLKVVQLQGEGKESRIQLRTPGGRVLGSHGEAAAFMEEEGNYGEEDIQNLYKVTVPQPVESKRESKVKGGTSNPGGSILAAPRRPGQNLSGELGLGKTSIEKKVIKRALPR